MSRLLVTVFRPVTYYLPGTHWRLMLALWFAHTFKASLAPRAQEIDPSAYPCGGLIADGVTNCLSLSAGCTTHGLNPGSLAVRRGDIEVPRLRHEDTGLDPRDALVLSLLRDGFGTGTRTGAGWHVLVYASPVDAGYRTVSLGRDAQWWEKRGLSVPPAPLSVGHWRDLQSCEIDGTTYPLVAVLWLDLERAYGHLRFSRRERRLRRRLGVTQGT